MERLTGFGSPGETAATLGYVSWEEVNVSNNKGRREVHYYLKRIDGGSDLFVIGKEKSLGHMSYYCAIRNLANFLSSVRPKSRREVIGWLNSIVSGSIAHESFLQAGFLDNSDPSDLVKGTFKNMQSRKLGRCTTEFLWLGSSWTCKKRRKHYKSFCRNGVKVSVHDFVYVLAEEDKRLIAYLEDMYEDSKGNKMVMVRWFHKIDEVGIVVPHNFNDREIFFSLCLQDLSIECIDGLATVLSPQHYEKFLKEAIHTRLNPFVCSKQFENDDVKPFDVAQVKGYWRQEILRYMFTIPPSKDHANSQQAVDGLRGEGNGSDITRMRPIKRLRQSKDNDDMCIDRKESVSARCANTQNLQNSGISNKSGNEICNPKAQERVALFSTTETTQKSLPYLNVGSEVEVLSQDSGIRGCWFRASIIKKHRDKVKVRYQDIDDAADEANKLEEWILASRVAATDPLAIRICGRTVIRPTLQVNLGKVVSVVDVGTAVDVWWHDAWWEGIVVQKESEDKIHVFFPGEKKESVFCCADLRLSHEWMGKGWTRIKERPDILTHLSSCLARKHAIVEADEDECAQAATCDFKQVGIPDAGCSDSSLVSGSDKGNGLGVILDLSKDDLLAQLRWTSLKKRRRGSGSSGHKMHHNCKGVKRLQEVIGSDVGERFRIPIALTVDHENCKGVGDSLFNSVAMQSLIMSR